MSLRPRQSVQSSNEKRINEVMRIGTLYAARNRGMQPARMSDLPPDIVAQVLDRIVSEERSMRTIVMPSQTFGGNRGKMELTAPALIELCHNTELLISAASLPPASEEILRQKVNAYFAGPRFTSQFAWGSYTEMEGTKRWTFATMKEACDDAENLLLAVMQGLEEVMRMLSPSQLDIFGDDEDPDYFNRFEALLISRLNLQASLLQKQQHSIYYWHTWFKKMAPTLATLSNIGDRVEMQKALNEVDHTTALDEDGDVEEADVDNGIGGLAILIPLQNSEELNTEDFEKRTFQMKQSKDTFYWNSPLVYRNARYGGDQFKYLPTFDPSQMHVPSAVSTRQVINLFMGRELMDGIPPRMQNAGYVYPGMREEEEDDFSD
jgi:hypothetical protein